MYAQMSTVNATELRKSTTSGYFVLTGMIVCNQVSDLPLLKANADARVILNALTLPNVPAEGDKLSNTYPNWLCVDRSIRPRSARIWDILCIFRWTGALQIRDHTSLEQVNTVYNKKTGKPIYKKWTDPNPAPGTTAHTIPPKICVFPQFRPLDNLTYTKTVPFSARADIKAAKNCVNNAPWQGYGVGFWLVSDVVGETLDGGITYTYSVTFSTRTEISWAEYDITTDDMGQDVYVDPTQYAALRALPYVYGLEDDTTCPGVVRYDGYETKDFFAIFGIKADAPTQVDLSGIM